MQGLSSRAFFPPRILPLRDRRTWESRHIDPSGTSRLLYLWSRPSQTYKNKILRPPRWLNWCKKHKICLLYGVRSEIKDLLVPRIWKFSKLISQMSLYKCFIRTKVFLKWIELLKKSESIRKMELKRQRLVSNLYCKKEKFILENRCEIWRKRFQNN